MSRELSESRLRLHEDQLAELQEELRRVSENSPHSDSLQTVLTYTHTHARTHTRARARKPLHTLTLTLNCLFSLSLCRM